MKYVRLGDVSSIVMGSAPPSSSYNTTGRGTPLIAGAGDYGIKNPQPKKWTDRPTKTTECGDLIVCVRATIGDLNWADREYCLGRGVAGIKADENQATITYLAKCLDAHKESLTKLGTGSTFLAIRRADLENFEIPLPSLPKQKRIAAILDAADALRANRRKSIEQLDSLIQSTFLEMFGDPVTNPKGWEVKRLNEIVERLDGGKNVAPSLHKTNYRVLKVSAVTYGQYRPQESKWLPHDFDVPDSYLVKKNDLLISRANTVDLIGATAFVWQTPPKMVLPDKIWKFVWKPGFEPCPLFIYALTQNKHFRQKIGSLASGTSGSMKNIAKSKLLGMEFPSPPTNLQKKFASIVESIEQQKTRLKSHLAELDTLFASLQSRAFNGKL